MSPEQLRGEPVDCRTDVFATGIVLWEMLTGRRLFGRPSDGSPLDVLLKDMLSTLLELPSGVASVSPAVDRVVLKALKSDRAERFATADEMAVALAAATDAATPKELGAWVGRIAGDLLAKRTALLDSIEQVSAIMSVEPVASPAVLAPAPPTASLAAASTVAAPTASMNQITLPIHDSSTAPRTVGSPVARHEAANEASGTLMSPRGAIPPAVETTSLSVASDSSPRRANVPFLVVLGVTLLVVASAGGLLAVKRAKSHAAAKAAVSSLPSASVSAVPSASVSSPPPSPVAPPPSAAPPVAMPSAPPAGSGHVAKPTGSARRPHPSAAPARPACDPPFTIDAEGVRIPRPECMGN